MNNLPKIIINDGYGIDAGNNLTSITIPNNVDTFNGPAVITTYATTVNWLPSTASTLTALNLREITSYSSTMLSGYTALKKVTMDKCLRLDYSKSGAGTGGMFYSCSSLEEINFPSLISLSTYGGRHTGGEYSQWCMFIDCSNLKTVNMPNLAYISCTGDANNSGAFYNCGSLTSVTLPKLKTITGSYGAFNTCTNLETLILGSEGNAVTALSSNAFKGCTQSSLTITIYTTDGASLTNQPWGATNATIIYEEA